MSAERLYDDDDDDEGACIRCNGEGVIMICIDDMCRGTGECIHRNGYLTCPKCKGED